MKRFIKVTILSLMLLNFTSSIRANFSVTPSRMEGDIPAGSEHTGVFTIYNAYPMDIKVGIQWKDYTISPLSPDWLKIGAETVDLPSNVTIEVPYTISIPENATGGYYARIHFTQVPNKERPSTFIVRYNNPVYVTIPGTQKYDLKCESPSAENSKSFGCIFFVTNTSNVHFRIAGTVTVTSLADNKTYTLMINKTRRPLMPQQMISYTSRIEGNPRLPDGEYSAEFNAYLEEAPDVKWSESLRFTIKDKDIQYPSDTE